MPAATSAASSKMKLAARLSSSSRSALRSWKSSVVRKKNRRGRWQKSAKEENESKLK